MAAWEINFLEVVRRGNGLAGRCASRQDGFGPVSVERDTDFTEQFEGYVLLLLPTIVLFLGLFTVMNTFGGPSDWTLRRDWLKAEAELRRTKVTYGGHLQQTSKEARDFIPSKLLDLPILLLKFFFNITTFSALITCASLAHLSESKPATIVGYTAAAIGTLLGGIISFSVHRRTYRPSPLLQSFGVLQAVAIAIRTRTGWTNNEGAICITSTLALASAVLSTILEGIARISMKTALQCGLPPDEISSVLSIVTAQFVQPLFSYAYKQHKKKEDLDENSIWNLRFDLRARGAAETWEHAWKLEVDRAKLHKTKPRFWYFLAKNYFPALLIPIFLGVLSQLSVYASPILLEGLLTYLYQANSDTPPPKSRGWELALGFFAMSIVTTALTQSSYYYMLPGLLNMRTGIIHAVFQKAFTLAPEEWSKRSAGDLSNHISVDAERFCNDWANLAPHVVGLLPQLALGVYIVYRQLSWAVFPGLAWMLIIVFGITPFQGKSMAKGFKMTLEGLDKRNSLIQESVSEMQFVKFNAWELPLMKQIYKARAIELEGFRLVALTISRSIFASQLGKNATPVIMFAVYAATHGSDFNAQKIFVSLTAIALVQTSFDSITFLINWASNVMASGNRVAAYLQAQELDITVSESTDDLRKNFLPLTVKVDEEALHSDSDTLFENINGVTSRLPWLKNATAAWKKEPVDTDFKLKDVTVTFNDGELFGIVGKIASGKSSFIAALLGQMHFVTGQHYTTSLPIAFCPQTPFLISASIQENITWGLSVDMDRVNTVIRACCLETDLNIITGGLKAEVGEKGLNLSGGQKARLALARACYAALSGFVQCVILDDVLSAVDAETDKKLFDNVIGPKGLFATLKLTRILVTHASHHFPKFDRIALMQEGSVRFIGKHADLLPIEEYKDLVAHNKETTNTHEASDEEVVIEPATKEESNKDDNELTEEEEILKGHVTFRTYLEYVKAGGWTPLYLTILAFLLPRGLVYGGQFWLTHFLNMGTETDHSVAFYLSIYGVITMISVAFLPAGFYCSKAILSLRASKNIFESVLPKVFGSTPKFFDTTPSGRITTRLSGDQRQVDNEFSMAVIATLSLVSSIFVTSVSAGISTHGFFLVAFPILVPIFFAFTTYAQASSRSIRRLDSGRTRAPLYAIATETFTGITSISAYQARKRYTDELFFRIDRNQKALYWQLIAQEYLTFRVDTLSGLIVFVGTVIIILLRKRLSPGLAGIAVSSLVQLSAFLAGAAQTFNDIETGAVHLERVLEYRNLPQEAPSHTDVDSQIAPEWPDKGSFEFKDYSTKYRPNLPLCLKSLNFKLEGGKRLAIVGRSGSGKSSMTLALFRLLEASEGAIFLDGVDIKTLGLTRLRNSMAIVPQTPSLFGGTLRSNLCPLTQHSDEELWKVLETVGLKDYVSSLAGKLDEEMLVSGRNFSAGQLQQITLARALLNHVQVLVLDEATSNMDTMTDGLIQKAIREGFAGCTVITVAHRIRTILDYDQVLVLSAGEIAEYGRPMDLLKDCTSKFWLLAHEAGEI